MNRRRFLTFFAAGAGASALPAWLSGCGGEEPAHPQPPGAGGPPSGKPLLVILVPKDESMAYYRGELLGGVLNHGGIDLLADLALVDVACLDAEAASRAIGRPVDGEPLMLLVEPNVDGGTRSTPIHVEPLTAPDLAGGDDFEKADRAARARVTELAGKIRGVVAPDRATLERRAAAAERGLSPDDVARVKKALADRAPLDRALVDRAAALVRLEAERDPDRHADLVDALAEAAIERLVKRRIPGSKWADAGGCGMVVEGEPSHEMFACGMGMVPEVSRRFLMFFTKKG